MWSTFAASQMMHMCPGEPRIISVPVGDKSWSVNHGLAMSMFPAYSPPDQSDPCLKSSWELGSAHQNNSDMQPTLNCFEQLSIDCKQQISGKIYLLISCLKINCCAIFSPTTLKTDVFILYLLTGLFVFLYCGVTWKEKGNSKRH